MVTIIHEWKCDICQHKETAPPLALSFGGQCSSHGTLPPDWSYIRGMVVCCRHRIVAAREDDVPYIWETATIRPTEIPDPPLFEGEEPTS